MSDHNRDAMRLADLLESMAAVHGAKFTLHAALVRELAGRNRILLATLELLETSPEQALDALRKTTSLIRQRVGPPANTAVCAAYAQKTGGPWG